MDDVWGTHAINGWFFCPSDYWCNPLTTSALRVVNGSLLWPSYIWGWASLFGFNKDDAPIHVSKTTDISNIYNGMTMQTLVQDGVNVAVLNDKMNTDDKQGKVGNKTFICSTMDNTTVYMWYVGGVTFSSLADYIIKIFRCYNAIQLDNGWTKAMIYNNKYIAGPWRAMMDAFVIIEGNGVWTKITPTNNVNAPSKQELQTAITWMYDQGLTMYDNIEQFLPNNTMTREEASKFYSVFSQKEFNKKESTSLPCKFYDINKANPTLRNTIVSSCKLSIFQWYKNIFTPKDKLNNAQAVTVLMRIVAGKMTEPTKSFYINYLLKAKELGLVGNIVPTNPIARGEAAIMLYKAHLYKDKNTTVEITTGSEEDIFEQFTDCEAGMHYIWQWTCVSDTQTCYLSNAIGTQQWNGSSRWSCIIASCEEGYTMQNGSCIADTRNCNINNGIGQQTRNWYSRWSCVVSSCNEWYIKVSNSCQVIKSRSCTIANGQWIQTWSYTITSSSFYFFSYTWVWWTCRVASCNEWYVQS